MATPTLFGLLTRPKDLLADLLAATAGWQAWVGETTTEAAKLHIHISARGEPASWTAWKAFALVYVDPAGYLAENSAAEASGAGTFDETGRLMLTIAAPSEIDTDDPLNNPTLRFENRIEEIMKQMTSLAGTPGYLRIRAIRVELGPQRFEESEADRGDYHGIQLSVEWWGLIV